MNETPKPYRRRWFRLTPERLLLALLPVWGVLLLSEHFRWLPKGYSVLLAVASLAVILVLLLLWFAAALLFRRQFQFTIRSLLVLMTEVAMLSSWSAVEMQEARRQSEVVGGIRQLDGVVFFRPMPVTTPIGPTYLRRLLGESFFGEIGIVWFDGARISDADLVNLNSLKQLQEVGSSAESVGEMGGEVTILGCVCEA